MTSAVALGCVLHVTDTSPVIASRRKELAAAGLTYVAKPPKDVADAVARTIPTTWGTPHYAEISWTDGQAWVIGFSQHNCLIDATSSNGKALADATHAQFETPGVPWQKLPPSDQAADRYGLAVTPPGSTTVTMVANVVGLDLTPTSRKEVITFQIAPEAGK